MSELTKFVAKIAIITLKNISDALLTTASEISKLNDTPVTLSQAEENQELVSLNGAGFTQRENYKVGDQVLVMLDGGILPVKVKISDVLQGNLYLGYFPRSPKSSAREIRHEQILGLDPNR